MAISPDTLCTLSGLPTPISMRSFRILVVSGYTVVFLHLALRQATRTLFSCQGTRSSVLALSRLSLIIHVLSIHILSSARGQPFFIPHG